jgi:hypothetical protein
MHAPQYSRTMPEATRVAGRSERQQRRYSTRVSDRVSTQATHIEAGAAAVHTEAADLHRPRVRRPVQINNCSHYALCFTNSYS